MWEEVLAQLDSPEQRALAALAVLDGGDPALVESAIGAAVRPASALAKVPLVERREDGNLRPHPLWRPALAEVLGAEAKPPRSAAGPPRRFANAEISRASAELLLPATDDRGLARAVTGHRRRVLHRAVGDEGGPADELAQSAAAVAAADEPAALLLRASVNRTQQIVGEDTRPLLDAAMTKAREIRRRRGSSSRRSTHLGHIAWWHDDLPTLAALYQRGLALESEGVPEAAGRRRIGAGDGRAARARPRDDARPRSSASTRATSILGLPPESTGCTHARWSRSDAAPRRSRSRIGLRACRGSRCRRYGPNASSPAGSRVASSRPVRCSSTMDPAEEKIPRDRFLLGVIAAGGNALLGRVDEAERCHADRVRGAGQRRRAATGALPRTHTRADPHRACGDDDAAADAMADTIDEGPIDRPLLDVLRVVLAPVYVLSPRAPTPRSTALRLGPDHQRGATCRSSTFVAARDGAAAIDDLRQPSTCLSALGVRWSLELAVRTGDVSARCGSCSRVGSARARRSFASGQPGAPLQAGAREVS